MGEVAEYIDQFEVSPLVIKQLLHIARTYPEYSVEASKIAIKLICDRRSIFKNYLIFKDHTNLSVFQNILKEKAESGDNDSISILNQLDTQISENFNYNHRQTDTDTNVSITFNNNNNTPFLKFSNIEDYYDSLLDSYRRLPVTLKSFKEIQEVLKRRSIDILMITGSSSQLNDNMVFYYNINPKYLKFFKKYQFRELELIMIYKFYDDRFITMIEYFRKRLKVLFEVATSTGRSIDGNREENGNNPYGNYGDDDLDDDDDDDEDDEDDDDEDDEDDDDDDDDDDENVDDDDDDMSEYQKNDREGERDSNISDDSNIAISKKIRKHRRKLKKRRNTNDLMNRYGIIDDGGVIDNIDNNNEFATTTDNNENGNEENVVGGAIVSNKQRNKSNKKIGYDNNNNNSGSRIYQEGEGKIGKDDIISNDEVISYFNCKWVIIYGYFNICDYNSVVKLFNKLIKSNPINNITSINVLQNNFHNFVVTPKVLMRCIILSFLITKSTSELIINLNNKKLLKNYLIEDKLLNELISNYINCKFKKFKLKIKELLINNENKFNFNFFKNSILIFKKIINIKIYLIYLSTIDQIKIDHLINKIGYNYDENENENENENDKDNKELIIKELSDIIILFNLNFKIDLKNGIIKSFNYSYNDILNFTNELINENNKKLINDSRILEINSMVLQDLK
ncbi:unnamed protein product [[Candida] boidinii]|uniref:Unnamed protein product n=1 Tax=Candida boidinii TaxID=5477 RepID=A0ACB5TF61_CANBO|nr:unnamed protein product [[Candida] boidinii]